MHDAQAFSFKDYSLSPTDLLPPNDLDEAPDQAWRDFCCEASTVSTDALLLAVTDQLSTDDTLRAMIEAVKAQPYLPGERKRVHISVAMQLAEAVERAIDAALGEQVSRRMAGRAA